MSAMDYICKSYDVTELRALAERAKEAGHWHKVHPANQRYIYDLEDALKALHEAANPEAILSLLDRVEKAEGALHKAIQLAEIAEDWNLDEVEIDGEMVKTFLLKREFSAALLKPE